MPERFIDRERLRGKKCSASLSEYKERGQPPFSEPTRHNEENTGVPQERQK